VASKKTPRSPKSSSALTDSTEVKAPRLVRSRKQAAEPTDIDATALNTAPAPAKRAARKSPAAKTPAPRPAGTPAEVNGERPSPLAPRVVTDEDIRVRAYFLSLEHRGQGSDIDFWLIAERELRPRIDRRN
jgi:hypothetical protein